MSEFRASSVCHQLAVLHSCWLSSGQAGCCLPCLHCLHLPPAVAFVLMLPCADVRGPVSRAASTQRRLAVGWTRVLAWRTAGRDQALPAAQGERPWLVCVRFFDLHWPAQPLSSCPQNLVLALWASQEFTASASHLCRCPCRTARAAPAASLPRRQQRRRQQKQQRNNRRRGSRNRQIRRSRTKLRQRRWWQPL